jgi:hypothetical protein
MDYIAMAERVANRNNDPDKLRRLRKDYRVLESAHTVKGRQILEVITDKIVTLDPNCIEARLGRLPIVGGIFKRI